MDNLRQNRNLPEADEAYAALIKAHEGLSGDESHALNARLILTLFNHVGDIEVIHEAIAIATPLKGGTS